MNVKKKMNFVRGPISRGAALALKKRFRIELL